MAKHFNIFTNFFSFFGDKPTHLTLSKIANSFGYFSELLNRYMLLFHFQDRVLQKGCKLSASGI